jgi:putative colanic acid biosynthesis glycosyltransferase WcaI
LSALPKRIVIFGINYAPELTGIAPYTTELAEHYAAQGHAVRVVTGIPHYPEWRRLAVPPPNRFKNPNVVRYRHFVPGQPTALGRMTYEATWFASASRSLASRGVDAVIGIVPSLSGGLLAVMGSWRWGAPVGIIVKDLMGPAASQSGYRGGHSVAAATTAIEGWVLRHASRVAVIADGFRPYLERLGIDSSRIVRIRDWTHPGQPTESREECRRRLGWQNSDFVCLHSGNMGRKQGLENVLHAASSMQERHLKIILAGEGNDRSRLEQLSLDLRLRNVTFIGLQPAGKYEAMLRAADVLILNQRRTVADMSLPSKLASYFVSGRPVIAAVSPSSDAAREVRAARAGLVILPDEPMALAKSILLLKRQRRLAERLGARGKAYADTELTSIAGLGQFDNLLEVLAAVGDNASAAAAGPAGGRTR